MAGRGRVHDKCGRASLETDTWGVWCRTCVGYVETFPAFEHDTDPTFNERDRCSLCGGLEGAHGLIHVRHGNGGGSNKRCPLGVNA